MKMSLTLFTVLFFIFTTTTTASATTTSPEKLIPTLKSKNITSVHLFSPNPQLISHFSNSNISLLLSIPNSFIPSFSSNSSATSAWLSTHVTPFLPHVRISAVSVGNNVTDSNLLKLLIPAIDNVREKVKELRIERVKVSTTLSYSFVTGNESIEKGLLGSLSENNATLFVNVALGLFKEVVYDGVVLKPDLSTDVGYVSLDDEEMMDYCVVEVMVLKAADMGKNDDVDNAILFLPVCICHIIYFIFMLFYLQSASSGVRAICMLDLMLKFVIFLLAVCLYSWQL